MLKTVLCKIEGHTPLLCNRFTDHAAMAATNRTSAATVGDRGSPKDQAEPKLYRGADEKTLIIPQPNLFRCIIDAGKFHKAGRSKITTQKSSLIPAALEIEGLELPIQHRDPWTVDSRPVRNPATGGRFLCYRPCFNDWALEFEMKLDTSVISIALLRSIIDDAGSKIGLGDFRPDNKGPFGKFRVVLWQVK